MQCLNNLIAVASCYSPKLRQVTCNSQVPERTHLLKDSDFEYFDTKRSQLSFKSITSTSNPFVKHCHKLRLTSSYRHSHGSVLVVGSTPIREILRFQETMEHTTVAMECLILLDKAEIPEGFDSSPAQIVRVNSVVMKRLSGLESIDSTEAIALMRIPASFINLVDSREPVDCAKWFPFVHRILVLEAIQDPGNLGTLVRSAMAFRWSGIFLLPGCCDPFNEKAMRASRGASFQLPIVCGNWSHLEALRTKFRMKMMAGHPESHDQTKPISPLSQELASSVSQTPLCLVLGSEGMGISEKTREECELVSIPMLGQFESLNVSVAGGILLYSLQPT